MLPEWLQKHDGLIMITILMIFDFIGTIAFAIAGAIVAIRKEMDLFGVNVLAVCTAVGGGVIRDILIGSVPPKAFRDPAYAAAACITANIVFFLMYRGRKVTKPAGIIYDSIYFWFDTLGLAAFTVDGVAAGINAGHGNNVFLIVFLGMMTGVGGGVFRDVFANRTPEIFRKHVYALSSVIGGLFMAEAAQFSGWETPGIAAGFLTVIVLRCLAVYFKWNLPRIKYVDPR